MIYSIVLVSGVQQSEPVIHISPLFFSLGFYCTLETLLNAGDSEVYIRQHHCPQRVEILVEE